MKAALQRSDHPRDDVNHSRSYWRSVVIRLKIRLQRWKLAYTRIRVNVFVRAGRFAWLVVRAMPRMCRQATNEWIDDNVPRLGAAVAFYTLLSLAPGLIVALAVAAAVYGRDAAEGRLAWEIQGVAGREVAGVVQAIVKGADQPATGVIATLAGVATLIFGASSVFLELHDALNTIWQVALPADRTTAATVLRLIRNRFVSFATVLGAGFLLLASLALNAWIAAMRIPVPRLFGFLMSYLFMAALFAALYKNVPDVPLEWSDVALGAMITAFLFTIGKHVMELYFAHTSFGSTFNAAGSPMVVLLWLYYSAQLFFWGAEFSKVYKDARLSRRVGTGLQQEQQDDIHDKN